MKIQGKLNGVEIDINIPDEIERANGEYCEVASVSSPKRKEIYWTGNAVMVADYDHSENDIRLVLSEIPRPTQEWLDEKNKTASEKPEVVKNKDQKCFYDVIPGDSSCEHFLDGDAHDDLIGKRRFILKERVKEVKKEWKYNSANMVCQYYHYLHLGCTRPVEMTCDSKCWQPIPEPAKGHTSCEGCRTIELEENATPCLTCSEKVQKAKYIMRNWRPVPVNLCARCLHNSVCHHDHCNGRTGLCPYFARKYPPCGKEMTEK